MPRVPTYDGPQVREAPLQPAFQRPVDVTRNTRAFAGAAAEVAQAAFVRQERMDQDLAFDTEAKVKAEWLDFETKLRENRKGRDAATYDAEVEQWWKDASQRHGAELSPGARRLVGQSLMRSQLQAVAGAKAYREQQLNASAEASYKAAQALAINEATAAGTEEAAINALEVMQQKRAERARLLGWTPEQTQADALAWGGTLHTLMVKKLMRSDPAAAQAYFDKNRGALSADQRDAIEADLQQVSAAADGSTAASDIWAQMGPKRDGQPVELDRMEQAARDKFKGDPVRQRAAIEEIRQRAGAHNSAEAERASANVNTVMDAYSRGTPLAKLRAMPEFLALPGEQRARILEHIDNRNHALWARSQEDRARIERDQQRRAYPAYLEYSDPEVLTGMSRQQVQALLPSLGPELTTQLVNRWEGMQNKGAKLEARMDTEDFNTVADSLGLSPYKERKSEDEKRRLGELKFRVEQLVDVAQQAKKGPLTRDEKMQLMRSEMARTVTVGGWFSDKQVPVIQLSQAQLADVKVPDADRAQIAEALRTMYASTKDPLYAPTEQNMRRLYLMNQSRAAALLPAEK